MPGEKKRVTFGVVADTHVPDRVKQLPSEMLDTFSNLDLDGIIHAGDACNKQVVLTLEEIAPVTIVQGNRDFLFGLRPPMYVKFKVNGIKLVVAHGHRSLAHYIIDKVATIRYGYRFTRYYDQLHMDYPEADIIIFGHTHHQTARWVEGQLLFNPGVAYPCKYNNFVPQYGVLSITGEGFVQTQFYGTKNASRRIGKFFRLIDKISNSKG
jgi:putative phosphoesterase